MCFWQHSPAFDRWLLLADFTLQCGDARWHSYLGFCIFVSRHCSHCVLLACWRESRESLAAD